jgi:hypothetical protein
MAKAQSSSQRSSSQVHQPKGYAKRISDHIAMALIVYTLMLIFIVTPSLAHGMRIWPYFLLIVMVAAVIPFFRGVDHRWAALENSELSDSGLKTRFNLDKVKLWMVAVGIPLILAGICRTVSAAT